MEWFCLPRPDSPSVFGAMLDRSAGTFRLGPDECIVPSQRRYVPGTLVLETTWQTPDGWLVVQDCLVLDRWQGGPRSERFRRASWWREKPVLPAEYSAHRPLSYGAR